MRLGIDIGGTKTAAVAIGADGELSDQVRMPTGFGAEAVVATALRTVERDDRARRASRRPSFTSIGIGIPGAVDSGTGRVTHAVNLGLEGLDLGPRLADRLGVDVRVENDVKAAALGAHHLLGVADGIRAHSMAYLNLGTGLAAGIVLDGRLLRGGHGVAGEIGHIPVDPAGVRVQLRPARMPRDARLGLGDRADVAHGASAARAELFDAADAGRRARDRGARAVPHGRRRRGAPAGAHHRRRRRRHRRRARRARRSARRGHPPYPERVGRDSAFLASLDLAARACRSSRSDSRRPPSGAALVGEHRWPKS